MTEKDPRVLNKLLSETLQMSGFGETGQRRRNEEAARLARLLPAGDLHGGEYADLWWNFCEDVADRIREDYPELAHRLYELAEESYFKEGDQDGHSAGKRVQGKRKSLPRPRKWYNPVKWFTE